MRGECVGAEEKRRSLVRLDFTSGKGVSRFLPGSTPPLFRHVRMR
jgi:hypothetical protein